MPPPHRQYAVLRDLPPTRPRPPGSWERACLPEVKSSSDSAVKTRRVAGRPRSTKQAPSSRGRRRVRSPRPPPGAPVKTPGWRVGLPERGQATPLGARPASVRRKEKRRRLWCYCSRPHSGSRGVGWPALSARLRVFFRSSYFCIFYTSASSILNHVVVLLFVFPIIEKLETGS